LWLDFFLKSIFAVGFWSTFGAWMLSNHRFHTQPLFGLVVRVGYLAGSPESIELVFSSCKSEFVCFFEK